MASVQLNLRDLNRAALERLVGQLIGATDKEEKEILDGLADAARKESEDLTDLQEEKKGKPSPVSTEEPEPKRRGRSS